MQFNHPEVLYALFLLIIPIIVHLFQLRKFQKEDFTNVKFLKKLTQQTRKSSRIKKLLVLTTRLLLLACLILAFAQPYFSKDQVDSRDIETLIYLDNSYSMQATGQRGRLLERNIQDLLEQLPEDRAITIMTNDDIFPEATRSNLQNITYSPNQLDFNAVLLQAENRFSKDTTINNKLLVISDFQKKFRFNENLNDHSFQIYTLPQRQERLENVSIDTVYTIMSGVDTRLRVQLSYYGDQPGNVPVSFFNGTTLLGSTGVDFSTANLQEIEFLLDEMLIPEGIIQTEDNGLEFDNSLYFSINATQPVRISSINASNAGFLNRIYRGDEFEFFSMPVEELDYNTLSKSQVIILNEIEDLPGPLATTLLKLMESDVIFIIIPPENSTGPGLAGFINSLGVSGFGSPQIGEKLITAISFDHPLFERVFEEQIQNFEYPKVQVSYKVGQGFNPILSFEDKSPFLIEKGGHYIFTSPLNSKNSNFIQSPLIVPTFYNMAIFALQPPQLYYLLGNSNQIDVPVSLDGDRVLQLVSADINFIPQQQRFSNKVEIITNEFPATPGNFRVLKNDEPIMSISYNVNRAQNKPEFDELSNINDLIVLKDLQQFFTSGGFIKESNTLWKWFVTFALFFLILETLLLKYIK